MLRILQDIINRIAPIKDIQLKENTKPLFDSSIIELITKRNKLKNFLHTKLHADFSRNKEIYLQKEIKEGKQIMLMES